MRLFKYIFAPHPKVTDFSITVHDGRTRLPYRWVLGCGFIALFLAIIALESGQFANTIPLLKQPVLRFTGLLVLAGLAFFYLSELIQFVRSGKRVMLVTLLLGALLRIAMLFSTPILEVDFNRYLWDGAVVANGMNPYAYSPEAVLSGENVPQELTDLAQQPGSTIGKINHAYLRTIYPPLTQVFFVAAYFIQPGSILAWQFLLFCADFATLLLIFALLRQLDLSPLWAAIFWLNPLYIKEIANSAHMDALIFPFLLAALLFQIRKKWFWAIVFLALSAGVKIWTIILLPLFLREIGWHWRKQFVAICVFGVVCTALLSPMLLTGLDQQAGIAAYANRWELNDSAFQIIFWLTEPVVEWFGYHPGHAQQMSRYATVALLLIWLAIVFFKPSKTPLQFIDHCLLVVAALFLLSPTQFPWYSLWLVPLLVFSPRKPLLLLTVLLPLYYLWYHFEPRNQLAIFENGIVWLEFVPVWLWLVWEWRFSEG